MDPITALTLAAGAMGSAGIATSRELVVKMLGPTADYIGAELLQWTEPRLANLGRIVNNAEAKLGDQLSDEGRVPAKVLKEILDDGSFAEDAIAVEYFGGVLASSRSGISRDDRGASIAKLVSQLTVYQLRTHFVFYSFMKAVHNGAPLNVMDVTEARKGRIFVPFSTYESAMEFTSDEDANEIMGHSLFGLNRLDLVLGDVQAGPIDALKEAWPEAADSGILVAPSLLGVELYLYAFGLGAVPTDRLFDEKIVIRSQVSLPEAKGVVAATRDSLTVPQEDGGASGYAADGPSSSFDP